MNRSKGIPLSRIAWIAALLPLVTSYASYLIAANFGHVPWCVPYWDSCTSISATGREMPAKYVFKFGMIPTALIVAFLWWGVWRWLVQSGPTRYNRSRRSLPLIGIFAAFFLMQYTLALGETGDGYRLLRRSGVVLTFALTFIAQLLCTRLLGEIAERNHDTWLQRWHQRLMILLVILLFIGVLSVILDLLLGEAYDAMEDAFEWIMALLLNGYFAGLAIVLHQRRIVVDIVDTT